MTSIKEEYSDNQNCEIDFYQKEINKTKKKLVNKFERYEQKHKNKIKNDDTRQNSADIIKKKKYFFPTNFNSLIDYFYTSKKRKELKSIIYKSVH